MYRKLFISCCLLGTTLATTAQNSTPPQAQSEAAPTGWYAGIEGGVPFGVSTFSSFGADKTRAGFDAGLYGGYRFNPVLSLEMALKWGRTSLSAQECCIEKGYWLGADGIRYNTPVIGMEGWGYGELKSRVSLQQYGVRLNVNVLGFFERTRNSRWSLEVSPLLAAVGTRATLRSIDGNAELLKRSAQWHLGAGGNLQVGYRITEQLQIGLYSGITYLTGSRMDGAPEYRHRNNYLWESGIRVGWSFGKCGKRTPATPATPATQPVAPTVCPEPAEPLIPEQPAEPIVAPAQPAAESAVTVTANTAEEQSYPVLYFRFNSTRIASSELSKMESLLAILQQQPDLRITVTGWCDTRGTKSVNRLYSLRRARAVKAWLVNHGIEASRITARGAGSDYQQPDAEKARRAETTENTTNE